MEIFSITASLLTIVLSQKAPQSKVELIIPRYHKSEITAFNISETGRYIVSGDDEGTIKLWDTYSGKELRTFEAQQSTTFVLVTNDGKRVVSSHKGGSIFFWNSVSGELAKIMRNVHSEAVIEMKISGDTKYLISRAKSSIRIIDTSSWEIVKALSVPTFRIEAEGSLYGFSHGREVEVGLFGAHKPIVRLVDQHPITAIHFDPRPAEATIEDLEHIRRQSWRNINMSPVELEGEWRRSQGWFVMTGNREGDVKVWSREGKVIKVIRPPIALRTKRRSIKAFSKRKKRHQYALVDEGIFWSIHDGRISSVDFSVEGAKLFTQEYKSELLVLTKGDASFPDIRLRDLSGALKMKFPDKVVSGEFFVAQDKKLIDLESGMKTPLRRFEELPVPVGSDAWLIQNGNGFYYASKDFVRTLHFSSGVNVYAAENYDLEFNRPDIIAQDLGFDSLLVNMYRRVHERRLRYYRNFGYLDSPSTSTPIPKIVSVSEDKVAKISRENEKKIDDALEIGRNRARIRKKNKQKQGSSGAAVQGSRGTQGIVKTVLSFGLKKREKGHFSLKKGEAKSRSKLGLKLRIKSEDKNSTIPKDKALTDTKSELVSKAAEETLRLVGKQYKRQTSGQLHDMAEGIALISGDKERFLRNLNPEYDSSLETKMRVLPTRIELDRQSKSKIEWLFVTVNGVPLFGEKGYKDRRGRDLADVLAHHHINIPLNDGDNRIVIQVRNEVGVYSQEHRLRASYKGIPHVPNLYLITIGASKFREADFDLPFAQKDARDIAAAFKEHNSGFGRVIVRTLVDEQINADSFKDLKKLLRRTHVDDRVLITFSGHGLLDKNLNYYIATYATDFSNPMQTALNYGVLKNLLDGIPARRKALFIDTCHSGEVDEDDKSIGLGVSEHNSKVVARGIGRASSRKIEGPNSELGLVRSFELMKILFADLRRGTGADIVSAARGMEFSYEAEEWNNGVFSYVLLSGLKDMKADLNGDRKIMLSELKIYVREQVPKLTLGLQQPTFRIENIYYDWRVW